MFEKAKLAMKKDNKPDTIIKHNFLFGGLMTCKNCGSAIVGDIKKGKYIYYFCADKTKGCECKRQYVREEDIEKVIANAIKAISITEEMRNEILIALKDSFVDQSEYNNEIISKLNKRVETLRGRISNIYMDKLDKKIDDEFWREKHNEWTYEVSECLEKISYYTNANADYMKLGGELLELLENLYPRYISQNKEEKKKLLKIIFSNLTLEGRNIGYTYKKPFNLFVEGASCQKWWRIGDSNS